MALGENEFDAPDIEVKVKGLTEFQFQLSSLLCDLEILRFGFVIYKVEM